MTNEELDQARAAEAWRLWIEGGRPVGTYAATAARLAREGWMPVDPLVDEAKRIAERRGITGASSMNSIRADDYREDILAALKRGIEIGKEKAGD